MKKIKLISILSLSIIGTTAVVTPTSIIEIQKYNSSRTSVGATALNSIITSRSDLTITSTINDTPNSSDILTAVIAANSGLTDVNAVTVDSIEYNSVNKV
jgi:hypothetical protein